MITWRQCVYLLQHLQQGRSPSLHHTVAGRQMWQILCLTLCCLCFVDNRWRNVVVFKVLWFYQTVQTCSSELVSHWHSFHKPPKLNVVSNLFAAEMLSLFTYFYFKGSAVALHCGKAHVQSQWERANFDPRWHQNPWNFSSLSLTSMITSRDIHQCKFLKFQSIQRGLSPDRWNITVLSLCGFFPG